jgi:uncharacterized protein (TIGR03083 family)
MSSIQDRSTIFGYDLSLDPAEVAATLTRATPWLDANLRNASDPSARVKGLTWNVGDVAAHLAATAHDYRNIAEGGAPFPVSVPQRQSNIDAGLARSSERRPAALADRIRDDLEALAAVVVSSRPDQAVNWYSGTSATPAFLGATVLGEVLVHGWDIATASHGDTRLDPSGCRFGVLAAAAASTLVLTAKGKTVSAALEYRIRGYQSIGVELSKGNAHITTRSMRRPDLWFEGEPEPFVLWMYTRTGVLKPLLNRSIRLGGRRPWRVLAIASWFETA